jgi:N-acyl-D-aspartate/D-glutamate deacylase
MLQHWVRDRSRGARMPIETAIQKLSGDPAALYGFNDRGVLAAGKRADVNIIDLDKIALQLPRVVRDLPTGAPRLLQEVNGIDVTMLAGVPTFRNGVATGAHPGRLLRRTN